MAAGYSRSRNDFHRVSDLRVQRIQERGSDLGGNLFGATFFTLTGFHGAHVTLGIIWLLAMAYIGGKGRLGPDTALDVELLGLYWHFVDIVWIVIFTLLYLIGGFDAGPAHIPSP